MRILSPLSLLLVLAACSGSSAPPPPVASAAPADELRPLSSRENPHGTTGSPAAGTTGSLPGAALPPGHPPMGGAAADPHGNIASGGATKSAGSVSGTISIAPKLSVAPSDVLYLIARKGSSTLAARRVDKPVFPFAFEISGGDVMMSGVAFEGPLDVVARVSRTGDAIPAKGDIEGIARNVKVPSQGVKLTIDSVRQ